MSHNAASVALALSVMLPLLAALLLLALPASRHPLLTRLMLPLVLAPLFWLPNAVDTLPQHHAGGWPAPLGIELRLDGLALALLVLTGIVMTAALWYATCRPLRSSRFVPLCLGLWSGLNGLYLSADIFNIYVCLELLTVTAVALVAESGRRAALAAALRYLLWALLASLLYLLGVALLYGAHATLDLYQLADHVRPASLDLLALVLILAGIFIKAALFPFHAWLPPAHSTAPAAASAILSALVVKSAIYLLYRLSFWSFDPLFTPALNQLLGFLGSVAILYGSLQALRQTHLKNLIAYSTVAQLGYLLLVFPLGLEHAWAGVLLLALAHGLAKTALFLVAGNLQRLGVRRIDQIGAIAPHIPLTLASFGLAGISLAGLPPTGGFAGKWLLLQATLGQNQWWWLLPLLGGGLLAAAYTFAVLRYAFAATEAPVHLCATLQPAERLIPWLLALAAFALGLFAMPLLTLFTQGAPA